MTTYTNKCDHTCMYVTSMRRHALRSLGPQAEAGRPIHGTCRNTGDGASMTRTGHVARCDSCVATCKLVVP
jgi:hypothetical protein